MQELSIRQRNNLQIGNALAAELAASAENLRSFIVVSSYFTDGVTRHRPSKYLNAANLDRLRFSIRTYEIDQAFIESWDADRHLINDSTIDGISSFPELENLLRIHIQDLSILDIAGRNDNPV